MNSYLLSILLVCCTLLPSYHAQSTTCDDAYECWDETIVTTYAYCYGWVGCGEANISSSYVYAFGGFGAYLANVSGTFLIAYGYAAGYKSTVSDSSVYGHGYLAMHSATVETNYFSSYGYLSAYGVNISPLNTTLYVYLYGLLAGYNADITCYSGDTCYVYCGKSYGCYGASFYCYDGATCSYDCDDTPDYCPTFYSVGEDESSHLYLSDIAIKEIYDKNVAQKKKDEANGKKADMPGIPNGAAHGLPPNFNIPHDIDSHYSVQSGKDSMSSYVGMGISIGLIAGMLGMLSVYCYMRKQNKYGYMEIEHTVELQ